VSPAQPSTNETARQLTEALKDMTGRLDAVRADSEERDQELHRYGRRNRHLILTLALSLILDVTLTIVISIVAVQAHNASITARKASASNLALCQAGNVSRHQQVELWDFVIGISKHPRTPQQKKVISQFETRLHTIFAPRNCAHLRNPQ
jgi:hypothetical protein